MTARSQVAIVDPFNDLFKSRYTGVVPVPDRLRRICGCHSHGYLPPMNSDYWQALICTVCTVHPMQETDICFFLLTPLSPPTSHLVPSLKRYKVSSTTHWLHQDKNHIPHLVPTSLLALIMATGIEAAGLVLGAFPLAIEAIKAYSDGMKTVKDMKNYQQILRQFSRDLRVERCKYDNTLLGLLTELVGPAKASRMTADIAGAEWNDEDFRSQLKSRLGPAKETLDNWLYVASQLNEALCTVGEKFKLPSQEQGKVPPLRICPLCPAPLTDHATST